jgi:Zn-dependent metalloprotease
MDVANGLLKAEQSSIITPAPVTNDTEKTAIRNFCQLNIRKKQLTETSLEERKEIRSKLNAAKKEITEYLTKNNIDILVLSKEDFKRLEEITAERGIPMVPMFARLHPVPIKNYL